MISMHPASFTELAFRERFRAMILSLWANVVPYYITFAYHSCSLEVGILAQEAISALAQSGLGNINPRNGMCVCVRECVRVQAVARTKFTIGLIARIASTLPPDLPQLFPSHRARPRLVCQAHLGQVRWAP